MFRFFVTSGYFIATTLNRREKITCTTIASFFYRRIRQLLPVYFTVIALTLLISLLYMDAKDRDSLIDETRSALCLYSNLKNLFGSEDFANDGSEMVCFFLTLSTYLTQIHTLL
jgi:peptidoglycan/LPS O-acetylase OafA/YrhL